MAILAQLYFKKETLETLVQTLTAKGDNGVSVTVAVNDETKEFTLDSGKILQQNASAFVSQSKEDKDAGKKAFYIANGRKVWDNGNMPSSLKYYKEDASGTTTPEPSADTNDDLPF